MWIHGLSLLFMVFHGSSWFFMVIHGSSWFFMVLHGSSWPFTWISDPFPCSPKNMVFAFHFFLQPTCVLQLKVWDPMGSPAQLSWLIYGHTAQDFQPGCWPLGYPAQFFWPLVLSHPAQLAQLCWPIYGLSSPKQSSTIIWPMGYPAQFVWPMGYPAQY